jgi:hypothetical protein
VIVMQLWNRPGFLSAVATKFRQHALNLQYVYGNSTRAGLIMLLLRADWLAAAPRPPARLDPLATVTGLVLLGLTVLLGVLPAIVLDYALAAVRAVLFWR